MDNFLEKQYCRLCLGMISNENYEKISNVTIEILDIILLKLDLDKSKDMMCKGCALKVKEALKFKSMCMHTDNTIIHYIDVKPENSIDLVTIYVKQKGIQQLINTLHDQKVCRLCMQLIIGEYMSVHDVESDAFKKYIPEMNINVIKNPVMCKQCFDSLGTHSSFIKNCLEMNKKIKNYYKSDGSRSPFKISVSTLCAKVEESYVKQEKSRKRKGKKIIVKAPRRDNRYKIGKPNQTYTCTHGDHTYSYISRYRWRDGS